MIFTFYNTTTGDIMFVSDLQSEDNAKNITSASESTAYVSGEYQSADYTIQNGLPVAKSQSEVAALKSASEWARFRDIRDQLLAQCDWTQVPDAPVDQAAWAAYRQALRDLPSNTVDPNNPQWPERPV